LKIESERSEDETPPPMLYGKAECIKFILLNFVILKQRLHKA